MFLRVTQLLVVAVLLFILFQQDEIETPVVYWNDYWREILFGLVAICASWLFFVTQSLRPVVAIFATCTFFVIAKLEEPSAASFFAALDGIKAHVFEKFDGLEFG